MADAGLNQEVVKYLKDNKIPDLMEHFLHELMVEMPDDPVEFLLELIQKPDAPKLIFTGPPASGKGTQCAKIVESYGVVHISTGDMLREEVRKGTELGKEADSFMQKGLLVPDATIVKMVIERLKQDDCKLRGWLLDGFPRTKSQALALQSAGIIPQRVILIECSDEVVIERIEGRREDPVTKTIYHMTYSPPTDPEVMDRLTQRKDDTAEAITVRLEAYRRNEAEIVGAYSQVVAKVNGDQSPDLITEVIKEFIDSR